MAEKKARSSKKKTKSSKKKSAAKKKIVRRPKPARAAKKKSAAKGSRKGSKAPAKKPAPKTKGQARPAKSKAPVAPAAAPIPGTLIGTVTHYFSHVNAAAIKIETAGLKQGDELRFKGHTTDLKQGVASMQIDHKPVLEAGPGDEVGIRVSDRVRPGDKVYKQ